MRRLLAALFYVLMLGPPHAIRLHAEAQGTGDELDGVPLWLAVAAEFMLRAGIFLVVAWGFQSSVSSEDFRRFHGETLLVAVYVAGVVHTLIYTYCFGVMWRRRTRSKVLRTYRIMRNLVYSIIPALLAAGLVLKWQDYNQIALFYGNWVEWIFLGVWLVVAVLGLLEALLVNNTPHGIDKAIVLTDYNAKQDSIRFEKR